MIHRGFCFRLYPTVQQEALFAQWAGVCRLVYNLALEQRRGWWRQHRVVTGRHITYAGQASELTALRAEFDWIAAVPIHCQQYALRDLDNAYQRFFAGEAGYPTQRLKAKNDAFRLPGRDCRWKRWTAKVGLLRLPKVGNVKFRMTRAILGTVKNITIRRDPIGWHVVFSCEIEHVAPANLKPAIGIDRGIVHTLALSDGSFRDIDLERLKLMDRRIRKQQRELARKKRGSRRREQACRLLARTRSKAARIRKHWNHVQSRRIADAFGVVVLENLSIRNMTASAKGTQEQPGKRVSQKTGLNRAILANGWGQFAVFLAYKLAERGGQLRLVNPAFTSQTCSVCATVDSRNRESQAVFRCTCCGHTKHADTNAAINILQAGTRPTQRGAVGHPMKREPRSPE